MPDVAGVAVGGESDDSGFVVGAGQLHGVVAPDVMVTVNEKPGAYGFEDPVDLGAGDRGPGERTLRPVPIARECYLSHVLGRSPEARICRPPIQRCGGSARERNCQWQSGFERTTQAEVRSVNEDAVVVDLEVDFHNEDETGYLWTWLSEARDPALITPDRIVLVGDDDALAMAGLSIWLLMRTALSSMWTFCRGPSTRTLMLRFGSLAPHSDFDQKVRLAVSPFPCGPGSRRVWSGLTGGASRDR